MGSRQSGACRFLGCACEFQIYIPDVQVEHEHKCNEQTVGTGWTLRWTSRFQIYMPAGQVVIFHDHVHSPWPVM